MLIFAINSATSHTEVALLNVSTSESLILFESTWASEKNEAEKILPTIQSSLIKAQKSFNDLDAIFVVSGPGSFTGLRVGVTIANSLAFAQKIPMMSCTTFELMQLKVAPQKRKDTAVILGTGGSTIAVMKAGAQRPHQMDGGDLENWLKAEKGVKFLVADVKADMEKKLHEIFQNGHPVEYIEKLKTFGEALEEFFRNPVSNQRMIHPVYLQKPTITQSKKQIFVSAHRTKLETAE